MTWTNLSFPFGSVLTSAQMTNLDDNFEALAAGDSGAPKITLPALDDTIKTNIEMVSSTVRASIGTSFANYLTDTITVIHSGSSVAAQAMVTMAGSGSAVNGSFHARLTIDGTVVSTGSVDIHAESRGAAIPLAGIKTVVASGSRTVAIQTYRINMGTSAKIQNGAIASMEVMV